MQPAPAMVTEVTKTRLPALGLRAQG